MKDYNLPMYDEQRNWIKKARERGIPWERIRFGNTESREDFSAFLRVQQINSFWEISEEDWENIVRICKQYENERKNISFAEKNSIISNKREINNIKIPENPESCWQKYRGFLINEKRFSVYDVDSIEESSERILKRLNSDTKGTAVKGLVIGNVQSGKTANMAALMAMAADYGWNMFIVLSGTIENLRVQTLNRMLGDLKRPGCIFDWVGIAHPSKKSSLDDKAQVMNFSKNSHSKYLTVVLKNSKRLKDLIQWLHEDKKSANQMKIMIIDDESDQASINTKKDESERTKINELLINLVSNKDENGNDIDDQFKAMNYIGYTATPYANVLNEAHEESLYPHDFISTLQVPKTYFGPQQIFGDRVGNEYPGLDIIREIPLEDVERINEIHKGESCISKSLEKAICWFLCCAATYRAWDYKKPTSMLIHTSQKQKHHEELYEAISVWFKNNEDCILEKCKDVWNEETAAFTKSTFFRDYSDFSEKNIKDYPKFEELIVFLKELIYRNIVHIRLGEEGEFEYERGIHVCVDNCKNNTVDYDGAYMRLAYPDSKKNLDFSTAFIVIGGATLSRGLTIEGLTSTYFLRTTKQADTLMQMGRWFGYRRGYELLQRVWLTSNATEQFVFLADLDTELRTNIANMELFDKRPRDYAVIVKNTPAVSFIRITAKNKMKGAIKAERNYSGINSQTHLFIDDEVVLNNNYKITENFINGLGMPESGFVYAAANSNVWTNIKFTNIWDGLLSKYEFHNKLAAFMELDAIKEWIIKMTKEGKIDNWNVVLFGKKKNENVRTASFTNCEVNMVTRTRKSRFGEKTIDIRILTDPKEKIADVKMENLTDKGVRLCSEYKTKYVGQIRKEAGLEKVPSIVIYIIDRFSKSNVDSTREDLNAPCDLVGISLNIPGERFNNDYTESIKIDLKKYSFEDDVEEDVQDED